MARERDAGGGQVQAAVSVSGRDVLTNGGSFLPTTRRVESCKNESREMLGIIDQLRYNGLDHSPATQTRRSSRMRVKLQLVLCSDEGQEETVTEVITLNKTANASSISG